MFINVLVFLHVKVNSTKTCEEISFSLFFRKILMSAVFRLIVSEKLMATPVFFVNFNSLAKTFLRGFLIWRKHVCI